MGCVLIVLMHGVSFSFGLVFEMKEMPITPFYGG
jgi:hypothetical protein